MGRRGVVTLNSLSDRYEAAQALRTLVQRYDIGAFQAALSAADMIDVLAGFALDVTQPPEFRRLCANDVLDRASGKPATRTEMVFHNPADIGESGRTVGEEIEGAMVAGKTMRDLERWMSVPPENWPEPIRAAMGIASATETPSETD